MYSVLLVGPMLPATKRGRSGLRRVNSSAARRASSAAVLVDLGDVFVQAELRQRQRRGVEGARLDDVGAGFEIGAVDVLDKSRLRQHQRFGAVLERLRVLAEALAAVVLLLGAASVDEGAHGAVQHQDALRRAVLRARLGSRVGGISIVLPRRSASIPADGGIDRDSTPWISD